VARIGDRFRRGDGRPRRYLPVRRVSPQPARRSLLQCGEDGVLTPVPIGPRALDVLGVLVARAGDLVSRDEIIVAAWPEAVVSDNNLNMRLINLLQRSVGAIRRIHVNGIVGEDLGSGVDRTHQPEIDGPVKAIVLKHAVSRLSSTGFLLTRPQ
jgi:DNA-binding response OmpR family regulator